MQIDINLLQQYLLATGMNYDEFMRRLIRGLLAFHGKTQKEIAAEHNIHHVSFCQMLAGKKRWRKGLLPSILHDLDVYEPFREIGLI